MTSTAPPTPTTRLFDGLFDDAALFPPGNAAMAAAVPAHRLARRELGRLVGPLVLPAARLDELVAELGPAPDISMTVDVSVIVPAGDLPATAARVAAVPSVTLAAVEVPVATDAAAAAEAVAVLDDVLPAHVPAAVEVPRTEARDEVLDVLAGTRYRAKLRTGGLRADLFPSPAELAGALHACATRGLAVKCTAGLHSAVRHADPATGFVHHGFLNVLVAASELASGEPPAVAAGRLGETDPGVLVASVRAWSTARAARARALFTSYGTCSITEPVDDLVALGLLPSPEPSPA